MAALEFAVRPVLSIIVATGMGLAVSASAGSRSPIVVGGAWTRPTAPGMNGAAYLVIANRGPSADALISASSPLAASVSFHRSAMVGAVMTMRRVSEIPVPAHARVVLAPGGLHLMLEGLRRPLRAGQKAPLRIDFRLAGAERVELAVGEGPPA